MDEDEFLRMLVSDERRMWQDPTHILLRLGLKPKHRFLDVASGPGFFAVEASRIVGGDGYVYCVDANPKAADMCSRRLADMGYRNYIVVSEAVERARLPNGHFDVALVANVLHDFEDPLLVLRKVHHALVPKGVLGVVDWKKAETPFGPPVAIRLSEEQSRTLVERAGFRVAEVDDSYAYHYLIKAVKQ